MRLPLSNVALVVFFLMFQGDCAASPRDNVNDALRKTQRDTQSVVKNVQQFLTMTGRWSPAPSGNDMQVCQSLQAFQAQVEQVVRANNSSQTYSNMQMQLQQLNMQAQVLDQQFAQAGMAGGVAGSWSKVKNDLAQATQALYFGGSASEWNAWYNGASPVIPGAAMPGYSGAIMPGTPFVPRPGYPDAPFATPPGYMPGGFPASPYPSGIPSYPGYNGDSGQTSGAVHRAERSFDRVVQSVTSFLTVKGKWPPQAGSAEMQLCQQLQVFQQQLRKIGNDTSGRVSYAVLQADIQQLAMTQSGIDSQLMTQGVTPDVLAAWNSAKMELSVVYQSFYSGGGQYFWAR